MEDVLLKVGLGCIIAAIVGGGLEFFGVKVPLLDSRGRQGALAGLGVILIVLSLIPTLLKRPTVSGKVFDIASSSGQGISGVRLTLVDPNGNVVDEDIFTTGPDGGFQFTLPNNVNQGQLPLRFRLSRMRWAAKYVLDDEKITDLRSDRQINIPVDLSSISTAEASPTGKSGPSTGILSTPISALPKDQDHHLARPPSVASSSGEKTLLQTGTMRLSVRGSPDYLDFELHVRPTDSPELRFDVMKSNALVANVDVGYGLNGTDACTVYLVSINGQTGCGRFKSKSTVTIRPGVDEGGAPIKIIVWHIPKQEINAEDGDAHFIVVLFNKVTKGFSCFPSQDFSQTFRTSSL